MQDDGTTVLITEANQPYPIDGASLTVVGLAELGGSSTETPWDDCYDEDSDNQIDIILRGDDAAMRKIRNVIIPAQAPYSPFFNPGGPGMSPEPGVTYTSPGPRDVEPVQIAIDDPKVVNYP